MEEDNLLIQEPEGSLLEGVDTTTSKAIKNFSFLAALAKLPRKQTQDYIKTIKQDTLINEAQIANLMFFLVLFNVSPLT